MTNVIIFVANGFKRDNIRLQPWRYIYELAKHKAKSNKVIIITEGSSDTLVEKWDEDITVIETCLLSVKRQLALSTYINSLAPHELWWSTTPRSIAFYPTLKRLNCYKVAFITCPLYRWTELLRASLSGVPYVETKALWAQRFIPRFLFIRLLNAKIFNYVTVQSKNNLSILEKQGINTTKVNYLPVGIDDEDVKPVDEVILQQIKHKIKRKDSEVIFLYLGALRAIRGFNALVKAFPYVVNNNAKARLVILARGATEDKCKQLKLDFVLAGIGENVSIMSGWLTREEVWSYIELSDIVVLPFVLVPSDIPIAVLESLARGKPVVVSSVDGLPELAIDRGIITDPHRPEKFADDLSKLSDDKLRIAKYTKAAEKFIKTYPRWSDIGLLMDEVHSGEKS